MPPAPTRQPDLGRTAALIVAAGQGVRFGGQVAKQFQPLGSGTVLSHAVGAFARHPAVDLVAVAVAPGVEETARAMLDDRAVRILTGAPTRQQTVSAGLKFLYKEDIDNILISDAVRPFVQGGTITRVLDALSSHPAALPVIPVVDTLKRQGADGALTTVDRGNLWRAQTPQGFRYADILAAHRAAAEQGLQATDDAAVAEAHGLTVHLVEGDERAFKITLPADLERARAMISEGTAMQTRIGTGFDVHRLGPGEGVTLCGVWLPDPLGLIGHSDADVGAHAATDALLGAIGAGDIGSHFPPSDPAWRGAPSSQFLSHAAGLIAERGGHIVNLDVTLICERPKIGPHRPAMIAALAEVLSIAPTRVSVKATTSEGLGFTGRGEGIAAQAAASVALPG